MPLEIEVYKTIQERKDFYPNVASEEDLAKVRAGHENQKYLQVASIDTHRTSTLYELLLLKEGGYNHPSQIAVNYLYERVAKDLIATARVHLLMGATRYFVLKVDMAAGIFDMVKTMQFEQPKKGSLYYVKNEDYKTTTDLLHQDQSGKQMLIEAANRVQMKPSAYRNRRLTSGFIPEYMGLGADIAVRVYNRIYPMVNRITQRPTSSQ
jgi:hypothetical protein